MTKLIEAKCEICSGKGRLLVSKNSETLDSFCARIVHGLVVIFTCSLAGHIFYKLFTVKFKDFTLLEPFAALIGVATLFITSYMAGAYLDGLKCSQCGTYKIISEREFKVLTGKKK